MARSVSRLPASTSQEPVEAPASGTLPAGEGFVARRLPTVAPTLLDAHALDPADPLAEFPLLNPNPILRVAYEGQVLCANPSGLQFLASLGWTAGEPAPEVLLALAREARQSAAPCTREFQGPGGRTYQCTLTPVPDQPHINVYAHDITDLKLTEQALRLASQRLQQLVDTAPVGVIEFDSQYRISRWSGEAQRMFGWGAEEVLGRRMDGFRWIHEDDAANVAKTAAALGTGKTVVSVNRNYDKQGRIHHCEWYNSAVLDDAGRLASILSFVVDVTESKQTEEHLRRTSERLELLSTVASRLLATDNPQAIINELATQVMAFLDCQAFFNFIRDEASGRLRLNACAGIPAREVCKIQWLDYGVAVCGCVARDGCRIVATDIQHTVDPRTELVKGYGIQAYACHPLVVGGKTIGTLSFGTRSRPVFTDEELALMKAVTDHIALAMERIRSQESLRDSEQRFRALADNIPQMAWMTDATGWIFWYNQRWYDYTGTTLKEMEGWGWQKVHRPEHVQRVTEKFKHHVETGKAWEDTFPLRGKDGHYRWFLSRAFPIHGPDGRVLRWFGTNTDITEQRESERALREANAAAEAANRAKDEFLATLSHQLRTPLNPVLLATCIHRQNPDLPPAVREDLEMIQRNVELEARLIDDLLDITRIARGKLTLQLEPLDAHQIIRAAADICRPELAAKRLVLRLELGAAATGLSADPARLQQILWNLLKNAIKFTPNEGTITVRTRNEKSVQCPVTSVQKSPGQASAAAEGPEPGPGNRTPDALVIEVADTGIGIPPALLPTLFTPFEQGSADITKRFGGLGLGLAISRKLAQLHHGALTAHSDGLNCGATFALTLPIAASAAPSLQPQGAAPSQPAVPAAAAPRSLRLLLVEDHPDTARTMARILRAFGHQVTVAHTIESACRLADSEPIDLVVSDLGLPDGSGHQLMTRLKARHKLRGIAISGYGTDDDVRTALASGFDAHLTKPLNIQQLRQLLAALGR